MNTLLLTAWIACQSFDGISTKIALNNSGMREGNPLGKKIYSLKIGVNIGAIIWYKKLPKENRKIIPIIFASTGCAAGIWNTKQAMK